MPEIALIPIHNLPAPVLLDVHLVTYNLDFVCRGADEVCEERADEGFHAGGDDDYGDGFGAAPFVEGFEARVEDDVFAEEGDAVGDGEGDGVEHVFEGISEGFGGGMLAIELGGGGS